MTLKVYNTLSRKLEEFRPLRDREVGVYICGLTVYDDMHIGHARTYLAFDAILRYLKYRGYKLTYIQNITDVDDKIIKRARERGVDPLRLSKEYAEKTQDDQKALGLLPADAYPKVSENIPEIIDAVKILIEKEHAYETDSGVYFNVASYPDYGKLSNQDPEQLTQHRIESDPSKKSPLDFALWKKVDDGEFGFESPWGRGRPGWHIECSVMSRKHLGDQIDIHGGALDLIFPHHENEIAQSESLTGKKPFVKYWLHTGFLNSSGEKMSKSLGNILPVREFLKKHSPEALRIFILKTHYRSPVDYSTEKIEEADSAITRLTTFRKALDDTEENAGDEGRSEAATISRNLKKKFTEHMDDDFNTPQALAAVFDSVRRINQLLTRGGESRQSLQATKETFDEIFGVVGLTLTQDDIALTDEEEKLIEERSKLRAEKNWAEADRIRDEFEKRGITLTDRGDGTTIAERTNNKE